MVAKSKWLDTNISFEFAARYGMFVKSIVKKFQNSPHFSKLLTVCPVYNSCLSLFYNNTVGFNI